jgi:hypothetical protein
VVAVPKKSKSKSKKSLNKKTFLLKTFLIKKKTFFLKKLKTLI